MDLSLLGVLRSLESSPVRDLIRRCLSVSKACTFNLSLLNVHSHDGSPNMNADIHMTTKTLLATGACIIALASASSFAKAANAKLDGAQYLKDAKVHLVDARAIALKAFDGKIVAQELEKETGGSGLRYSFDIKRGAITHEVGVDAKTGKVLENSLEGADAD